MAYAPEKTINGTFGECWLDDDYVAEVTALQAKMTVEKQEVNQTGTLAKGYKITGTDGKGTLKMNKVSSRMILKMGDNIKKGKSTVCTIISKLADPDSDGEERVKLTGCCFDELTIVDWEAKKLGEESIPFTFTGFEVLDTIKNI
jgi:hypothetical protein